MPLTEIAVYRLRSSEALPFTLERAADTTVRGTTIITVGAFTDSLELTADATPRGATIHFVQRRHFQNSLSVRDMALRSGDPPDEIVLTQRWESGSAFDAFSQTALIGNDTISFVTSSIDKVWHVYANGVEISRSPPGPSPSLSR